MSILLLILFSVDHAWAGRLNPSHQVFIFGRNLMKDYTLPDPALFSSEDTAIEQQAQNCADEPYHLLAYAHEHLVLVATPANDTSSCQPVAYHDTENGPEELLMETQFHENLGAQPPLGFFDPIGLFEYKTIHEAFTKSDGADFSKYDIINNNCATFVLNMLKNLKVPVDSKLAQFVIDQLTKSPQVLKALRASDHIDELSSGDSPEEMSDIDLIQKLVVHYIKTYYSQDFDLQDFEPNTDGVFLRRRRL